MGEITARSVAKVVLKQWVARYGILDQIHSDQGLQFTSEMFRGLMGLLGITKTTTPAYNPRLNKVERLHRVLGNVLRSDQTGAVYQWVQKVPLAMFEYRTTVSNVTGVTPFKGVFGVDSHVPLNGFPPPPSRHQAVARVCPRPAATAAEHLPRDEGQWAGRPWEGHRLLDGQSCSH